MKQILFSGRIIFIAALDWGLGHVTRSASIIQQLSQNNTVIIGCTQNNRDFYLQNFPDLLLEELPSYKIKYSAFWPVWIFILFQWPRIHLVIKKENKILKQIVKQHKIDLIISDNRFGLFDKKIHSVFISHQVNLKVPIGAKITRTVNHRLIQQFDEIWIPDYEEKQKRLSGELSDTRGIKIPIRFIGPQSWLKTKEQLKTPQQVSRLILLSGVEPQRSLLEKNLVERFKNSNTKTVLVRGTNIKSKIGFGNIDVHQLISGNQLADLIIGADTIICRSGYSTLMDLHLLGKKNMWLVPTPGQPEQEYLAQYWKLQFGAKIILQNKLDENFPD